MASAGLRGHVCMCACMCMVVRVHGGACACACAWCMCMVHVHTVRQDDAASVGTFMRRTATLCRCADRRGRSPLWLACYHRRYAHAYTHAHTHAQMHTCTHAQHDNILMACACAYGPCACVYMHLLAPVCYHAGYACVQVYMCSGVHVLRCACAQVCMCARTRTHARTCTHTHAHTRVHTHIRTSTRTYVPAYSQLWVRHKDAPNANGRRQRC